MYRSYPHAGENTAKDERIVLCGIFEGEKHADDI